MSPPWQQSTGYRGHRGRAGASTAAEILSAVKELEDSGVDFCRESADGALAGSVTDLWPSHRKRWQRPNAICAIFNDTNRVNHGAESKNGSSRAYN